MSGHVRAEPAGGERPHRAMNTRPRLPTGRRAGVQAGTPTGERAPLDGVGLAAAEPVF